MHAAGTSIVTGSQLLLRNNQFPDFSSSWTRDILTVLLRKSMKIPETIPEPEESQFSFVSDSDIVLLKCCHRIVRSTFSAMRKVKGGAGIKPVEIREPYCCQRDAQQWNRSPCHLCSSAEF